MAPESQKNATAEPDGVHVTDAVREHVLTSAQKVFRDKVFSRRADGDFVVRLLRALFATRLATTAHAVTIKNLH